jgi:cytochrome b561
MTTRYSTTTIVLHWMMAIAIAVAFAVGKVAEGLPRGPEKASLMGWHVLLGMSVLALLLPRVLSRATGGAPDNAELPAGERTLAAATKHLFYLLMLALPLVGMATVMSNRAPLQVVGLFEIPTPLAAYGLRDTFQAVHGALAKLMLAAFVLHVLATAWHRLVRRDDVPGRMIPFLARRT